MSEDVLDKFNKSVATIEGLNIVDLSGQTVAILHPHSFWGILLGRKVLDLAGVECGRFIRSRFVDHEGLTVAVVVGALSIPATSTRFGPMVGFSSHSCCPPKGWSDTCWQEYIHCKVH
jgi:hypothetical protein